MCLPAAWMPRVRESEEDERMRAHHMLCTYVCTAPTYELQYICQPRIKISTCPAHALYIIHTYVRSTYYT